MEWGGQVKLYLYKKYGEIIWCSFDERPLKFGHDVHGRNIFSSPLKQGSKKVYHPGGGGGGGGGMGMGWGGGGCTKFAIVRGGSRISEVQVLHIPM